MKNFKFFVLALALAVLVWIPGGVSAQMSDLEYEPDEGLHEEEWYDPSDWFDTDEGIEYENDWYDYSYNYPYVYDYDDDARGYYGEYDGVYSDYDYDYNYYTDDWYADETGNNTVR